MHSVAFINPATHGMTQLFIPETRRAAAAWEGRAEISDAWKQHNGRARLPVCIPARKSILSPNMKQHGNCLDCRETTSDVL